MFLYSKYLDFCLIWKNFNLTERGYCDMKLDELNELEDEINEEDERVFEAYRLYSVTD